MPNESPLPQPEPAEEGLPSLPSARQEAALPNLDKQLSVKSSAAPQEARKMPKGAKWAAGGLALVVVGGLFAVAGPISNDLSDPDDTVKVAEPASMTEEEEDEYYDNLRPWYENDTEGAIPDGLKDWQVKATPLDPSTLTEDQTNYFRNMVEGTEFDFVAKGTLRTEELGYTSNVDEAVTEDGLPNPLYSYVTYEIFLDQTGLIVNRLLNPTFGGWAEFQFAGSNASANFDLDRVRNLFTENYQEKNFDKKDKSFLPLLADWRSNDYGRSDLIPKAVGRWYGEVTDSKITFTYDEQTLSYRAAATYEVEFEARTLDKKIIKRQGTLRIVFATVPGGGKKLEGANYEDLRVKIDDASLSVGAVK